VNTFDDLGLSPEILRAVHELGYEKPSAIQAETLPILLGPPSDFIGIAATGTGKTAAFGIPMLEKIDATKKSVQGLIMCPTRELALQVCGQINLLGKFRGIKAIPVYGGASLMDQARGLRNGAQIVVGTPGRLIDHLERTTLKLQDVQMIVLDEADEMISMGFKEDLETILQASPREKSQIWLFSATMDREVSRVADTYLRNAKQVKSNRNEMLSTTVEQIFYPTREGDKPEILVKIIEMAEKFYGLIFCQTKALVVDLTHYLNSRGYRVDCLHGDKTQSDRERTMQSFRDRKVSILICTDVASRGLDVKDITHVINYSIPRELDVYIHRIGRTARVGKAGVAISLVTPSHRNLVGRIENMTKSKIKEGKIPTRKDIGSKKVAKILPAFQAQTFFARAVEHLGDDWKAVIGSMPVEEVVGRFLTLMSPEVFKDQEKLKMLQQSPGRPELADRSGSDKRDRNRDRDRDRDRNRDERAPRRDEHRPPRREFSGPPRRDRDDRAPRRDEHRPPRREFSSPPARDRDDRAPRRSDEAPPRRIAGAGVGGERPPIRSQKNDQKNYQRRDERSGERRDNQHWKKNKPAGSHRTDR